MCFNDNICFLDVIASFSMSCSKKTVYSNMTLVMVQWLILGGLTFDKAKKVFAGLPSSLFDVNVTSKSKCTSIILTAYRAANIHRIEQAKSRVMQLILCGRRVMGIKRASLGSSQ